MPEQVFDLAAIGAREDTRAALLPFAARGLVLGRVSAVSRGQYWVYTEDGERDAEAIGELLYRAQAAAELPAAGDWVAVQHTGPGEAMIHAVLPRKTKFSRHSAGKREEEQMIAA